MIKLDKWEYKITDFKERVMDLNQYGVDGWELITVILIKEDKFQYHRFIFKRKKEK